MDSHQFKNINNEEVESCFICFTSIQLSNKNDNNNVIQLPCKAQCSNGKVHVHYSCIYNWMSSQQDASIVPSCPLCRGKMSQISHPLIHSSSSLIALRDNLEKRKEFVLNPIPKEYGKVSCYIRVIDNGLTRSGRIYKLYLQLPTSMSTPPIPDVEDVDENDVFLLSASTHHSLSLARSYNIFLDDVDDNSTSSKTKKISLASLKGNMRGNSYSLETTDKECKQLAGVSFDNCGKFHKHHPMTICVTIPEPVVFDAEATEEEEGDNESDDTQDYGNQAQVSLRKLSKDYMTKKNQSSKTSSEVRTLVSKEPELSSYGYNLDFGGRVTLGSTKNVQIVNKDVKDEKGEVKLQFGRVHREEGISCYTMDLQWPLSIAQAFGISLSICDPKI